MFGNPNTGRPNEDAATIRGSGGKLLPRRVEPYLKTGVSSVGEVQLHEGEPEGRAQAALARLIILHGVAV